MGDSVGNWAERIDAINALVDELTQPTVEVGRVIGAVAKGDLTQSMPLELAGHPLKGEYLRTAKLVNGMVGQLGAFSVEVIRVAARSAPRASSAARPRSRACRACGRNSPSRQPDGRQSHRAGPQHRRSHHRRRQGDLSRKITVDVRGEILQLKEAINVMVDQLRSFAAEVTRVAARWAPRASSAARPSCRRRRHVEGSHRFRERDGVQPHAQVRNIAGVTTAVARGDLSRKITVDVKARSSS